MGRAMLTLPCTRILAAFLLKNINAETNNAVDTGRVIVSNPTKAQYLADVLNPLHGMITACTTCVYMHSHGKPIRQQHGTQSATALNERAMFFNCEYAVVLVVELGVLL